MDVWWRTGQHAANSPEMLTNGYKPAQSYNIAYQTPYSCEILKSNISNFKFSKSENVLVLWYFGRLKCVIDF